jgi:hypothetical protein
MARLKNATSGVVVEVADEKVERLGSGWVSTDTPTDEPKRAPGRPKKADAPVVADEK